MRQIKVMDKYINPYKYIHRMLPKFVKNKLSDKSYLKIEFPAHTGYILNLNNPITYNEKLNWLKLYDRKSIYSSMVDKYEAKKFVSQIIGDEYIIPTIGIWDCFEEIDFDKLPNQFVLKCTHDSGGVVICKDKNDFDIEQAKRKINSSMKRQFFYVCREWPYKNLTPRIIAEEYLENGSNSLIDYKIYTFNGNAKLAMVNTGRGVDTRADYFNKEYEWMDLKWGYEHADEKPKKPQNYEKMYELAEKLAKGTYELRVDFYEVNGKVYFGELTFFDGGGFEPIYPVEWDIKMGEWIKLPIK